MSVWPFTTSRGAGPSGRILLDVGSASVAGACELESDGRAPMLVYGKRVPITAHATEEPLAALGRALALILSALETEGVTALSRAAPGTRVASALVALDAPWSMTTVRIEEERPSDARAFFFTKRVLGEMLRHSEGALKHGPNDRVDQQVVGARLNGYLTAEPVGKAAHRASLLILASKIAGEPAEAIEHGLRERLRIHAPRFTSGAALRYRALCALFPHERELLILDAAGPAAAVSLVRARTLVAVREFPASGGAAAWAGAVRAVLQELATSYPLPRTIFLVVDEAEAAGRLATLNASELGALWFSDVPPKVIAISRITRGAVTLAPEMLPDIRLALMAYAGTIPGS